MSYDQQEKSPHDGSKVELYLFETEDGIHRWTYTTGRTSRVFDANEYVPEVISRTEISKSAGAAGGEPITITLPFDNPVAVLHVPYLPPKPIQVTIYSYHRRDLSIEIKKGFVGYVTSFAQKGDKAELQCSQSIDTMQQLVPPFVYKSGCVHATYELGCGVSRAAFRTNATVDAIDGTTVTSSEIATKADNWFTAGYALNPATGETRFIIAHAGGTITLVYPFTGLAVNDVLHVFAGDDRTEKTCREKFNNKINYLAFDHSPNYNVFEKGTG